MDYELRPNLRKDVPNALDTGNVHRQHFALGCAGRIGVLFIVTARQHDAVPISQLQGQGAAEEACSPSYENGPGDNYTAVRC